MSKDFEPELTHLSNGIPVILQNYESPVAATYWWINVGSADEKPDEAGFAHFLEHMLFKDAAAKETGRASTGQMARAVESLGGDINAYTSFDQTVYHVTCASRHWTKIIDAFGTMAKPQRFLNEDFLREREVILEELRKNEDSPGRQLFQSLLTQTFKRHPYGKPVIGYVKTLKAAKVAKLEAFYRKHYVSGNMGLVLVGPIGEATSSERKKILALLEKHYGAKVLPKKPYQRVPRTLDKPLRDQIALVRREFDVKSPTLAFGFRAPDLMHADVATLDLAASVLGMGELSRLYQRLFYKTSLATDVSGGLYVPSDPGVLYFQVEVESVEKIVPAAEAMLEEFARIGREGPDEEELARVMAGAESERLYASQTADGMAGRLGFLKFIVGDLDYDQKYLRSLHQVDREKVQEVCRQYFDWKRMSAVVLLPKGNAEFDLAPIEKAAKRLLSEGAHPSIKIEKSRTTGKKVAELITLPSGVKVAYRENPASHVFSMHAATLGGLRLELAQPIDSAEKDWGSSHMMSLTWTKGAGSLSAQQIAKVVEGHAAGMDGFSGRNTVGLQLTGLAKDWSKLSDLATQVLLHPTFPESEVEHSRRVAQESARSVEDHSSQLCSKLFLETLFERHPYGHLTVGSVESLAGIDSKKLKAFHRAWLRPDRLVVGISGNVKRAHLDRWMEGLEASLKTVSNQAVAHPGTVQEEADLKAPRWVEKKLGREQTHIITGGLGARLDSEDRFALRILQTLLGGQSGRLFIELREKKSLAYTVAPISFEGIERGYVGTYIACSPSKTEEAQAGIKKVMETLAAKGPSASEMKRAKEFFLGRRAMELQSDSALASHYGLKLVYGLPLDEDDQMTARINRVSAKEIQHVCRKYFIEPHHVTSTVG